MVCARYDSRAAFALLEEVVGASPGRKSAGVSDRRDRASLPI
jgi:hypothetical protein